MRQFSDSRPPFHLRIAAARKLAHQLGARRLRIIAALALGDGVLDERDVPLKPRVYDGALDQPPVNPFKPALAVRVAEKRQVLAARTCRRTGGPERGQGGGGAVAVLAADLHRLRDLAVDITVAVAVLAEVAVDAMHAFFGMDRVHMDGLFELVRIVVRYDVPGLVQQVALAVALEDRTEVPAVAVIVGELGVVGLRVDVGPDVLKELQFGPFAARCGGFRVAVKDFPHPLPRAVLGVAVFFDLFAVPLFVVIVILAGGDLLFLAVLLAEVSVAADDLFFRPHQWGVGFVIPHRVAEIGVHEHVRLVHVAGHAGRSLDRRGEGVAQRVTLFALHLREMLAIDRRVDRHRLTLVAVFGVHAGRHPFTVVGVCHMAGAAAGGAIVARLVVRAHEPGVRIIEAGLMNVQHRNGDADAGCRPAVRLADVRAARLLQSLQLAEGVRQADLRELGDDVAPAPFKHAEDVGGGQNLPRRHGVQLGKCAARLHRRGQLDRAVQHGGFAVARERLAQHIALEGQDAVIVGRAAPQHRRGRHQRSFGGDDLLHVAGAAGLTADAVVGRVHKPDELRAFLVQQRVGPLRVGRGRPVPGLRVFRQNVRGFKRFHIAV